MKSVTRSDGCGCGQRGRLAMRRAKGTKDPNRPKLPMSAFFRFLAKFRQEYMVEHPNITMSTVINKAGGEKWRRMSKADQAPYKAEFDRAMKAYRDAGHMEVGNVPPHADDPEVGHAAAAAAADHELGLAAPVAAAAADQELGLAAAADHELGLAAPVAAAAADQELGLAAAVAATNHDLGHANDDDHELGHAAADDHELVYAAVAATNHDLGHANDDGHELGHAAANDHELVYVAVDYELGLATAADDHHEPGHAAAEDVAAEPESSTTTSSFVAMLSASCLALSPPSVGRR